MTAVNGGGLTDSLGAVLDSASSQSADAETASSQRATRDEERAWRKVAVKKIKQTIKQHLQCVVQSRGQVRQFFARTPCASLDEMLFALADTHGNVFVLSVVWVRMTSASDAKALEDLDNTYGTGDVTPIATEVLQLGGIRFTGQHYASRRKGTLVVIAETEPVSGQPSATLLNDTALVASVLPPP
jgi:hypothetical protein